MKKISLPIKIGSILFGILAFAILLYYICWTFSPGSYAKAETYELNVSEKKLIEIINQVKSENNLESNIFDDHKKGHWYSIYFEYKDKNQIIHALTRPKNKKTTTFYFSGYKKKTLKSKWISANEYFWWWKNTKAKKQFETRILEKIKNKINKESSMTNSSK